MNQLLLDLYCQYIAPLQMKFVGAPVVTDEMLQVNGSFNILVQCQAETSKCTAHAFRRRSKSAACGVACHDSAIALAWPFI